MLTGCSREQAAAFRRLVRLPTLFSQKNTSAMHLIKMTAVLCNNVSGKN